MSWNVYLFDKNNSFIAKREGVGGLRNMQISLGYDESGELTFTVDKSDPWYEYFAPMAVRILVRYNEQIIIWSQVKEVSYDINKSKTVYAVELSELLNRIIIFKEQETYTWMQMGNPKQFLQNKVIDLYNEEQYDETIWLDDRTPTYVDENFDITGGVTIEAGAMTIKEYASYFLQKYGFVCRECCKLVNRSPITKLYFNSPYSRIGFDRPEPVRIALGKDITSVKKTLGTVGDYANLFYAMYEGNALLWGGNYAQQTRYGTVMDYLGKFDSEALARDAINEAIRVRSNQARTFDISFIDPSYSDGADTIATRYSEVLAVLDVNPVGLVPNTNLTPNIGLVPNTSKAKKVHMVVKSCVLNPASPGQNSYTLMEV